MLELCDRAGFPLEPLDKVLVLVVLLVQDLQGDIALEQGVMGSVHPGHPAVTDQFLQLVSLRDGLPDHAGKLPALRAPHA